MPRRAKLRLFAATLILLVSGRANAETPDAALDALLAEARAEAAMPGACVRPELDGLVRILCAGNIRIGVRDTYPLFGTISGNVRSGYDVDVGRAMAERLGVEPDFVSVGAATRISSLGEGKVDLVIATMGHNVQRDGQVRFIRPHYYQSETVLVGPRKVKVEGLDDLAGHVICVAIGNGSNAQIVSHRARLMLFADASELPVQLSAEVCSLAAQDNSFFASYFTDPGFAERFSTKFGFAQVPWGMAVARTGSDRLARALDLMSQIFHRTGIFLGIGRANRIETAFLDRQQENWSRPECNVADGNSDPACVLPPLDGEIRPTSLAGEIVGFEKWVRETTGIALSLPMFKTAPAWTLFRDGIVNSLVLVAGALVATLVVALLLGAMQGARSVLPRLLARAITVVMQSSPVVLTVVIASAVAREFFDYSSSVAILAAISALGLMNGSNAGQAIGEALHSLHLENVSAGISEPRLFIRAVGRSATQLVAFLINAAKGTPVAAFIGAPELLSTLTDITSFASGRATTYTMLLVFYVLVVMNVVWLCGRLRVFLEGRLAA